MCKMSIIDKTGGVKSAVGREKSSPVSDMITNIQNVCSGERVSEYALTL